MDSTESTHDCDVVILGLGPGGEYAARKLAEAGLDVVGVEEALVGGECPFWGCTPSKLMVRPADLLAEVRRADRLAGPATVRPDWSLVAARIRKANHGWTDYHHAEPLAEAGVRIVRGHGRLAAPGVVRVEQDGGACELRAARGVLLDTGTRPLRLPIEGLEATPYWTNRGRCGSPRSLTGCTWSVVARTGWSWRRRSRGMAPGSRCWSPRTASSRTRNPRPPWP
jgi:pyruvate/2-oxoglutarate dehydrogenase complex dihydrolipoamide dehydrogenase (E3) component